MSNSESTVAAEGEGAASPGAEHLTEKGFRQREILGSGKAKSLVAVDRRENCREIAMSTFSGGSGGG